MHAKQTMKVAKNLLLAVVGILILCDANGQEYDYEQEYSQDYTQDSLYHDYAVKQQEKEEQNSPVTVKLELSTLIISSRSFFANCAR